MSPERYQRLKKILHQRQTDLTVCMEHVHKPQNFSAIVRTCDAVGVHNVHIVWDGKTFMRRGTSRGSHKWVKVERHTQFSDAHSQFKQQDMQVLVTHLSDDAVDFREIDYTKPTAIILGQEKYGASDEAIAKADKQIIIPMMGMVQSLNVSVAGALILYEAQRQRQNAGLYNKPTIPEQDFNELMFQNGYPDLYKHWQTKTISLPEIGNDGEIIASREWWQQMQLSSEAIATLDN